MAAPLEVGIEVVDYWSFASDFTMELAASQSFSWLWRRSSKSAS